MELYKKYRPKTLKEVIANPDAVNTLEKLIKKKSIPHAMLFTGPSGCGKTTLARILKDVLKCGESDFTELNCADFRGIDMVRDIRSRMGLAAISGDSRIWLVDECHQMTKDAQTALLKMLEDTPGHVYFMLATTDPAKLLKTIQTRCTEIRVKAFSHKAIVDLVTAISKKEGNEVGDEVASRIADVAEGSARKALVLLQAVINMEDEDEQLEAILSSDSKRQGIELARAMFRNARWPEIATILKGIEEEAETIRWLILSYATTIMLGGGKSTGKAFQIIQAFRDNFYDSKKAGLAAACYEVTIGKEF